MTSVATPAGRKKIEDDSSVLTMSSVVAVALAGEARGEKCNACGCENVVDTFMVLGRKV